MSNKTVYSFSYNTAILVVIIFCTQLRSPYKSCQNIHPIFYTIDMSAGFDTLDHTTLLNRFNKNLRSEANHSNDLSRTLAREPNL